MNSRLLVESINEAIAPTSFTKSTVNLLPFVTFVYSPTTLSWTMSPTAIRITDSPLAQNASPCLVAQPLSLRLTRTSFLAAQPSTLVYQLSLQTSTILMST